MSRFHQLWKVIATLFVRSPSRNLFLIFVGAFGIVLLLALASMKLSHDKAQKELAHEQALNKQQQEQRNIQEAQERRRLEQLESLRQLGIRGVEMASETTIPADTVGVWLTLRSDPKGAEVFLNWTLKGRTPLWLNGVSVTGLLVVVKDGYQPWFREIGYQESGALTVALPEETSPPRTRLLLLPAEDMSEGAFSSLRAQLVTEGFIIPTMEAARVFLQAERDAGGLSHRGLRAWVRANFNTGFLLRARVREQRRELSEQSSVLTGTVRSVVDLTLDLYTLDSGEHLALIATAGSAFAFDATQGLHSAITTASREAAKKLKQWLQQ